MDLGMYPPSDDYSYWCWNSDTDGALLMANALVYTTSDSPTWMSLGATDIVVPQGASMDVPVILNSMRTHAGTYTGTVNIASNDPQAGLLQVPVTFTVTPASDIDVSTDPIQFDTLFANLQEQPVPLQITNDGSDTLTVELILSDTSNYFTAPVSVAPFSQGLAYITFAPQSEGTFDGEVHLLTNDPDEPEIVISLSGVGVYAPAMTVTPDSIELTVDAGSDTVKILDIGNVAGLSNLQWNASVTYSPFVAEAAVAIEESAVNKKAATALKKFLQSNRNRKMLSDTVGGGNWMSLDKISGTVAPGNSEAVQVTADASGLLHGVYQGSIHLDSNDPLRTYQNVPVWLNVVGKPEINVNDTVINFSPIFVGLADSAYTYIYNGGTKDLELYVENTNDAQFSHNLSHPVITPGNWAVLAMTFEPSIVGELNGELIIYSNDETDPVVSISLSGTALDPPVALIQPAGLSAQLIRGTTGTTQFTIQNTGGNDLTVSIPQFIEPSSYTPAGAGDDGPEGFGYSWIDSNEPGGPQFDWIDISTTGTDVYLSDDSYSSVTLPFAFSYFGVEKADAFISSNGYLAFNSYGANNTTPNLMSSNYPNDLVSALGKDLYPDYNSRIIYHGNAERFVLTYLNIRNYGGSDRHTFQIILYPNGKIKFQYLSTDGNSHSQIGIEDADGLRGIMISNYSSYVTASLAVEFTNSGGFVTNITPGQVVLAPGTSQTFEVSLDATALDTGSYTQIVNILTNDPARQITPYEINLQVIDKPYFISALTDTTDVDEGASLAFQFEASNPRNSTLVYSLMDTVQNATISGEGLFVFNPDYDQQGLYEFTVYVDDGMLSNSHTFWIRVNNVNRAPYISNPLQSVTGREGSVTTIKAGDIFADYDLDPLEFVAVSDDSSRATVLVLDSGYVEIGFVAAGLVPVTMTATDPEGASVTELFVVEVVENSAPVLGESIPDKEVTMREPSFAVTLSDHFSDPDGNGVDYSYSAQGTNGDFSLQSDILSFTATERGEIAVSVTATDVSGGGEITTTFNVTIANIAPELLDTLEDIVTYQTPDTFHIDLNSYFADFESDPVTFAVEVSNSEVVDAEVENGILTLHIMRKGESTIMVVAEDTFGGSIAASFKVAAENRAPVVTGNFEAKVINLSSLALTYNLQTYFADADGEGLTYSVVTDAEGVVDYDVEGDVLTVTSASRGACRLTITASDGHSASVSSAFDVTVENQPVVLIREIPDRTADMSEAKVILTLSDYFGDEDGDELTYNITSSVPGFITHAVDGETLTIHANAIGTSNITVAAEDGFSSIQEQVFTLTMLNRAPVLKSAMADQFMLLSQSGPSMVLADYFNEPDGEWIDYSVQTSAAGVVSHAVTAGSLSLTPLLAGTTQVTVTATDPSRGCQKQNGLLCVIEGNPANMKAIVYTRYGDPGVLEVRKIEKPVPAANEVLIKVYAVSINDWDWGLLQGDFVNRMLNGIVKPKRQILGSDVAGRIEAVGAGVKNFQQGDEVFGDLSGKW
ncbi:MAG TPA: choice-of-anchor D domain-containing protein, partial [Chryseosolibacter sp.]|nr:choice-of-anchor D domain-containing protein [Chryseosolibacter sp.]